MANGVFYTALIAVRPDGSMDTGDITSQTTQTLENLKHCVEAAGGTMDDVAQVLAFRPSFGGRRADGSRLGRRFVRLGSSRL